MDTIDIFVYDHTFTPLGVIDHYESLVWTDRYYENGDFEMCIRMTPDLIPLAQIGNYLMRHDTEHVMVVESYEIQSNYEEGDMLVLTGKSLEGLLNRRIIIDNFAYEGEFQTLIQRLLNENIISPANDDRRIPGFTYRAPIGDDFSHYSVTEDSSPDADKVYYTRSHSEKKTVYVGFTGTEFESGVTYYERVIVDFIATTDFERQIDKTYYTASDPRFTQTTDTVCNPDKAYYYRSTYDGETRYVVFSGTTFVSGTTYYEKDPEEYTEFTGKRFDDEVIYYEAVAEYPETEDSEYDYNKRYYIKSTSQSYPVYTVFEGSTFVPGTTYYERTKDLIKREYSGGENLYTAISDICQEQDVGFKIVLDDKYNFIFSLYKGLDHTADQYENEYVIFSPEFNNVVSSTFKEDSTTYKNVLYALTSNDDESDMEFGNGVGLSRREFALDKSQFSVDAMDDSTIDSIVDGEVPEDDLDHTNEVTIDVEMDTPQQYIGTKPWNDKRLMVGSSHTGDSRDYGTPAQSSWRFFEMYLKVPFRSNQSFKDLKFNLTYKKAMNADIYVRGQTFKYGLGSNSEPGDSMTEFQWDTAAHQYLNCEIKGEFSANTDYYLWLIYNRGRQNNCYVQGVGVKNATATAWEEPEEVTVQYTKESTEQRAKEELENAKKTYTFDTEIDRVYTFSYRGNFALGDIIQIEDRYDHSAHALVTEVIESFDESGPASRPTFKVLEDTIVDDDSITMYDYPVDI